MKRVYRYHRMRQKARIEANRETIERLRRAEQAAHDASLRGEDPFVAILNLHTAEEIAEAFRLIRGGS